MCLQLIQSNWTIYQPAVCLSLCSAFVSISFSTFTTATAPCLLFRPSPPFAVPLSRLIVICSLITVTCSAILRRLVPILVRGHMSQPPPHCAKQYSTRQCSASLYAPMFESVSDWPFFNTMCIDSVSYRGRAPRPPWGRGKPPHPRLYLLKASHDTKP